MRFLREHAALALGALFLLLVGAMLLAVLPKRAPPGSSEPTAAPSLPPDPREEFVFELERAVEELRIAVTQEAEDQILECFASDFAGDTIFDATDAAPTFDSVHVRVTPRGRASSSLSRDAIRRFYRSLDVVTFFGTKVADAERTGEDRAAATIKWSLHARAGGGRVHIQERSRATLRREGDRWKFVALDRLEGRRVETDRALFETTILPVAPDIPCHGCAYRTPQVHLGGVALGDVDGDGAVDIFTIGPTKSHLLFNRGGTFEESPWNAGGGAGALFLDFDNDGDLDLFVTRLDPDQAISLYRNEGGRFEPAALPRRGGNAYSACAADYDGDGDLDIFVGFYGGPKIDTDGQLAYGLDTESFLDANDGEPDLLLRNDGGTFTDVTEAAGIRERGWTLACGFQDIDGDGRPDLYVVHDFGFNALYRNRGDGTFEDATARFGAGDAGFGMGLARADVDGDGDLDLYVSNMSSTAGARIIGASKDLSDDLRRRMTKAAAGNTLLRNDGARLENVADAAGVAKAGWAWGCVFTDCDNDGRPDLYVANGFVSGRHRTDL